MIGISMLPSLGWRLRCGKAISMARHQIRSSPWFKTVFTIEYNSVQDQMERENRIERGSKSNKTGFKIEYIGVQERIARRTTARFSPDGTSPPAPFPALTGCEARSGFSPAAPSLTASAPLTVFAAPSLSASPPPFPWTSPAWESGLGFRV